MLDAIAKLRAAWNAGTTTSNAWLATSDPFVAELASRSGFDSLCVDMQHGLADHPAATRMLQATATAGVPTFVRVPWNEPSAIMRALDAGAAGVIVPLVSSRAEAEAAVSACRYPPVGTRSFGPVRASVTYGDGYFEAANDAVIVLAMIETNQALEELDDILQTPGLDGVYIGPSDLALALGMKPRPDHPDPEHQRVVRHIITTAKRHGRVVGLHCGSPEFGALGAGWGADMVTIAADTHSLRYELTRRTAAFRELTGG